MPRNCPADVALGPFEERPRPARKPSAGRHRAPAQLRRYGCAAYRTRVRSMPALARDAVLARPARHPGRCGQKSARMRFRLSLMRMAARPWPAGRVVAAEVDRVALDRDEFGLDGLVVGSQLRRQRGEARRQLRVIGLGRDGLGPVDGQGGGCPGCRSCRPCAGDLLLEDLAGGPAGGSRPAPGAGLPNESARCSSEAARARELAERVPAQVVLLHELLHVLGGRPAGAGLEQAAAVHQRGRSTASWRWCRARGSGTGRSGSRAARCR